MAEDYRAGLGIDRATDDADRAAGRQLACPTLVVWSTEDDMQDLYGDVLSTWRPWAGQRPTQRRDPQRPPHGRRSSRRTRHSTLIDFLNHEDAA